MSEHETDQQIFAGFARQRADSEGDSDDDYVLDDDAMRAAGMNDQDVGRVADAWSGVLASSDAEPVDDERRSRAANSLWLLSLMAQRRDKHPVDLLMQLLAKELQRHFERAIQERRERAGLDPDRIRATFDPTGEEVSIKRSWGGHEFDENERMNLLLGKEVEFWKETKDGERKRVAGRLGETTFVDEKTGQTHKGFGFVMTDSWDPATHYRDSQTGIKFRRSWGGYEFSDLECWDLMQNEYLTFEAMSKNGRPYTVTGRLDSQFVLDANGEVVIDEETGEAQTYIGFTPDFSIRPDWWLSNEDSEQRAADEPETVFEAGPAEPRPSRREQMEREIALSTAALRDSDERDRQFE